MKTNKKLTLEMEANRCAISARDCDAARKFLEAYLGLEEKDKESCADEFFTHREGLLIAAIVTYSRAFTNSQGGGFAESKVEVNLCQVFSDNASKVKLHKTILEKRHNAVAHSTWEYHKTEVVGATTVKGVLRKHSVVDYGKSIDIKVFRKMAETMRDHFEQEALDRDVATKATPK